MSLRMGRTDARYRFIGHTGIGNKMRWAVGSGESILGVSVGGDIVEYGLKGAASLTKLHRAVGDTFRVDAVAYSPSKGILVVPFLGGRQDKTVVSPPHQVVLYKRGKDVRVSSTRRDGILHNAILTP